MRKNNKLLIYKIGAGVIGVTLLSTMFLFGDDKNDKFGVYTDFMYTEGYTKELSDAAYKESLGYHLMDMDGDEVPELLITEGTYSAARVLIYTCKDSKVRFVGAFSRNASIDIWTKENESIIKSQYGNQGCFQNVFSRFSNGEVETIGFFAMEPEDLGSEENVYYAAYPYPENLDDDFWNIDYRDSKYKVSEETYDELEKSLYETLEEQGYVYEEIMHGMPIYEE